MKYPLALLFFFLLSLTASAQPTAAFQPFEAAFQQKQKLSPRLMQAYRDTLIALREAGQQDQALTHFRANLLPRMGELPSAIAVALWYWAARSAMDIIRYNDAIAYAKPAIHLGAGGGAGWAGALVVAAGVTKAYPVSQKRSRQASYCQPATFALKMSATQLIEKQALSTLR